MRFATGVPPASSMGFAESDERRRVVTAGDDEGATNGLRLFVPQENIIHTGGKNRRLPLMILLLLLIGITFFLIQKKGVSEFVSSSSRTNPTSTKFISEEKSMTKSEVLIIQQQQQQQSDLFSKAPEIENVHKIPKSSQGRPQYSITRLIHNNDNRGKEGERTTTSISTFITINNTIPDDMLLLDDKVLWCTNAKAGTTSMYESIIFPMNFTTSKGMKGYERCYDWNNCPILAKSVYKEHPEIVMSAPSFTIVRNPWDRIRTCYEGKIKTKKFFDLSSKHPKGLNGLSEKFRFSEYKKKSHAMTFVEFLDHVARYPKANDHWVPHSMNCLTVQDKYGQLFHYDHIIKIEDGLFPQVQGIFDLYHVPYPSGDLKIRNLKNKTLLLEESNNTNKTALASAVATKNTAQKITTTTTGSIDGDDYLIKFYREAASVTNISMEELIEKVRLIYEYDVKLYNYSFPSYQ